MIDQFDDELFLRIGSKPAKDSWLSALRTLLDFSLLRWLYRVVRTTWREICIDVWGVFYGDRDDRHWMLGFLIVFALFLVILTFL